jgi:hypothetical protein
VLLGGVVWEVGGREALHRLLTAANGGASSAASLG